MEAGGPVVNLTGINKQDIVLCDVRSDRFYATVTAHLPKGDANGKPLAIESLTGRPIPAYHVSARQVVGHWRKAKGSRV